MADIFIFFLLGVSMMATEFTVVGQLINYSRTSSLSGHAGLPVFIYLLPELS